LKENIFRSSTLIEKNRLRNKEYFELQKKYPDITPNEAYDIIEGPIFCSCGKKARFVSLKLGYSKYCSEECHDLENGYDLEYIFKKLRNGWKPSTPEFIKIKKIHSLTPKNLYDNLYGPGKCKYCSKETTFKNFIYGYLEFCSVNCSNHFKDYSRTPEKNEKIQEKRKKTSLLKFGVECNLQLIDTAKEKNIFSNDNNSEKSLKAKEQKKQTMLERYGTTKTSLQDYIQNREFLTEEYILQNFIKLGKFNCEAAMEFFNCSRTYFNKFNLPLAINKGEDWLFKLIGGKKNDRTLIKPLELDILSSDFKFCVEFNGLAFHSSGYSISSVFNKPENKNYHLNKTDLVEAKGYQLFHIFENEFLDIKKRNIWTSIIKNKMLLNEKIHARKTSIKIVSSKESNTFLDQNHLQGAINSHIRLGLFYNDELVSLMTFGKSRFNRQYEYELLRFCSKKDFYIPGAGSKLLKYFEINYNPKSLISYANRRWSQGNLYKQLGFTFSHCTDPNYFYFLPKEKILYSRNQFQKHLLKDKLETFDENLSETQNMFNNGYRKIYDCGNLVYFKKYK